VTRCDRFRVSGRVQGVFFRASAQEQGRRLGLTGWARNLDNGDVEVLACGEASALGALEAWLGEGPPLAKVERVMRQDSDEVPPQDFGIRY
jgi:acylphosphatase